MLLEVKAIPNSRQFRLWFRDGWRVNTASPPQKGKANQEIEKELGRMFSCTVRVVRGAGGRRKVLEVGLDEDAFKERTKAYLEAQEPSKSP